MKAERARNPFWQNPSKQPAIVIYLDASPKPPYRMHWHAIVTAISADAKPGAKSEEFPDFTGFAVKGVDGDDLHFARKGDMIKALQDAGWTCPLYRGMLARITGTEGMEYVGQLPDLKDRKAVAKPDAEAESLPILGM